MRRNSASRSPTPPGCSPCVHCGRGSATAALSHPDSALAPNRPRQSAGDHAAPSIISSHPSCIPHLTRLRHSPVTGCQVANRVHLSPAGDKIGQSNSVHSSNNATPSLFLDCTSPDSVTPLRQVAKKKIVSPVTRGCQINRSTETGQDAAQGVHRRWLAHAGYGCPVPTPPAPL